MAAKLVRLMLGLQLSLSAVLAASNWDFTGSTVSRVLATEQVVQGVVTFNGSLTAANIDKINWASNNVLSYLCGHGSTTASKTLLVLKGYSEGSHNSLDIEFAVLPTGGGGGDCAMALYEASKGGSTPPWVDDDPTKKKPAFRRLLQTELSNIAPSYDVSDWVIAMHSVYCEALEVWKYSGHMAHPNPITDCSAFGPSWDGFTGGTTWAGSADEGSSTAAGFESSFTDLCNLGSSACLCSVMEGCVWRSHSSGGMRCLTKPESDTAKATSCADCPKQDDCPVTCSGEISGCSCADSQSPQSCQWDDSSGTCADSSIPGSTVVSCSACWQQSKCDSLRPNVESIFPAKNTLLGDDGADALVKIVFDKALDASSAYAAGISMRCIYGQVAMAEDKVSVSYYLDPAKVTVVASDTTIQIDTDDIDVTEELTCSVVMNAGVALASSDGLPTMPLAFGEYYIRLPDVIPPAIVGFSPAGNAVGVKLSTTTATLTFTERVQRGTGFEAYLTELETVGVTRGVPEALSFVEVKDSVVRIDLSGKLVTGKLYQITLTANSVEDYGSNKFTGVGDGVWTFRAEGEDTTVVVIEDPRTGPGTDIILGAAGGALVLICLGGFLGWKCYQINNDGTSSKVAPEATEDKKEAAEEPVAKFHFDDDGGNARAAHHSERPPSKDKHGHHHHQDHDNHHHKDHDKHHHDHHHHHHSDHHARHAHASQHHQQGPSQSHLPARPANGAQAMAPPQDWDEKMKMDMQ